MNDDVDFTFPAHLPGDRERQITANFAIQVLLDAEEEFGVDFGCCLRRLQYQDIVEMWTEMTDDSARVEQAVLGAAECCADCILNPEALNDYIRAWFT